MRIDWEDFFPLVKIHCDQVPDSLLKAAICAATIEFCEKTLAYRADLDPLMVVAGTPEYEIDPPDLETRIITPLYVALDERELKVTCEDEMPDGWRAQNQGTPQKYLVMTAQALWLHPTPDANSTQGLFIRAALKPTRTSTGCEEMLLEEFGDVIAHGAVARIMEVPGKAWSDTQLSAYHGAKFTTDMSTARVRTRKGNTTSDLRVVMRQFV